MTPLFGKLNLRDHRLIHVLDAPASFEVELAALSGVDIRREIDGDVRFALAFAITQAELDRVSRAIAGAAKDDAVVWVAYPKGSSRRHRCEFNRDSGWTVLGEAGFEPVRQVAIDDDWSALRFRRAEHIKSLRRDPDRTISAAGKRKAGGR
jgi:hypothetical protein